MCAYINSLLPESYTKNGDSNLVCASIATFKNVTQLQKRRCGLCQSLLCLLRPNAYRQVDLAYQSSVQIT
jgi:hypothetical protein